MSQELREYRIAFLTNDWNFELVEDSLHGLKQYVDDHPNVRLSVFDCFGKDKDTPQSRSEYMIYQLADFSQFDGVIVQGSQIVLREIRDEVAQRIAESGIPAVSISCPMPGCTVIGFDNKAAQKELTDHVIREHSCHHLVYLTGLLDNSCPEGQLRLDGFLEACHRHDIPEENIEIIPCTWRTADGVNVARQYLQSGKHLPDAFICANDDMAIGLIGTLQEHGRHVPGDVIVTGFDNLNSAKLSSPRLTTVHSDLRLLHYQAMDMLIEKIDGGSSGDDMNAEFEVVNSESCGCADTARPGMIRNVYFQQNRFLKNFYTLQDQLAEGLFEADDLDELLEIIGKNRSIFGCRKLFLCVNSFYYDNYGRAKWENRPETFDSEMVLSICGRKDQSPVPNLARFPTRELLPAPLAEKERFLIFYPLHYNTCSIGYLVMNSISTAAKLNLHESIFSFLEIAMENARKKVILRQLNETLDELYVRDALTGLYNRFGYSRFAAAVFDTLKQNRGVQIVFTDLDHMKQINDQFGHENGDEALRAMARILEDVFGKTSFIMRYGGDEFISIVSGERSGIAQAIDYAIARYNRSSGMPFTLSASTGTIFCGPEDPRTVDECVQAADTLMYEAKARKRHP